MNAETYSTDHSHRIAFTGLKPKRRSKTEEVVQSNEPVQAHEHVPVLINARAEFSRQRARLSRSGRPNVHWRRVTPPTELSELLPNSRTPMLARVVDKIKTRHRYGHHHNGVWALLRWWVLAFR
jgi:hypothetical protein